MNQNAFPLVQTAAQWTSMNPILDANQRGLESDTGKEKIGDGHQSWKSLSYMLLAAYVPVSNPTALSSDQREILVSGASWTAGHTYADSGKDGIFYIEGFTDASGSNVGPTYTNLFGGYVTKTGAGNIQGHWVSINHQGTGQAGLFIGDATSTAGGDLFGSHRVLTVNTTDANVYGDEIDVFLNVATAKTQIGQWIRSLGTHAATVGLQIDGSGGWGNAVVVQDTAGNPSLVVSGAVQASSFTRIYKQLLVGPATPSISITGESDIGRLFGGGSSNGLLVYTTQGGAGASGIVQVRDNSTDNNVRFQVSSAAPASGASSLSVSYNNGSVTAFNGVTVGAADSGGTGFRVLRVPN